MVSVIVNCHDFYFQFLLIFRKAAAGELLEDSGLNDLYKNMTEIDVDVEGVSGAKDFFMSKVCKFFIFVCFSVTQISRKYTYIILTPLNPTVI